ncbi:MAG: aminodeoxychorismate synthase component I [Aromatoleum sp.]|jgi:para-aminobenzoate synthetase/4-amino-4-deoxychorismate lyase|uniref:aminodeoxychorismate synthase component I n=1 Tax=Aromatoleum sp. TaxID=2307007 RepID=UPI0028959350|nr:aminodeoxychorismate synthase component I [Aromatoleum sp.]MDT3672572.1 aminodeoxychorismate synthase component I [Aromatoleum sp.]
MLDSLSQFALFDDNRDNCGDLLLSDLEEHIVCRAGDDVGAAFRAIAAAQKRGRWTAVAASYELGYALEPRLSPLLREADHPLVEAWVFRRANHLSNAETADMLDRSVGRLSEHEQSAGVAALTLDLAERDYRESVVRIRRLIEAGDCYQVNYTFALRGETYGNPLALYRRLRDAQPVRHGAFIRHGRGVVLSRSPELFVERQGQRLTCRPMKGTAPRSEAAEKLAGSDKDRAENVMIVDLLRNDLGRLAPAGGVRVTRLGEIEAYPSVWQMTSTVVAEPVTADLETVFRALFPCGSITGAPKIRAMQIIDELEPHRRGVYCGALGWISPGGDFRFSVPIRTLDVDNDGKVTMGIGSGIVADSDPSAEWAECALKARFLTGLHAEFGLIETLRCEPANRAPYPLLELHLERLTASAGHFGFRFDPGLLRAALLAQAAALTGPHRVRVQLAPSGNFEIAKGQLEPRVGTALATVAVSAHRVSSQDPLSRHKTTLREAYDREFASAAAAGHFDVLFLNELGELAEGARTNVFLDLGDGTLWTPPLTSGALDGVYRRKLIAEGAARERRLTLRDLLSARAIHIANALRGLVHVELATRDQLK